MIDREWELYMLDCEINERGLPIDMKLVQGAIAAYERNMEQLYHRASELTHLHNPNSVAQLTSWLAQRGVVTETLDKVAVRDLLAGDLPEDVRELLEVRQLMALTSIKKLYAVRDSVSADGRLRNTLQFYGASRTGRYAGRLFQPQNIPRGHLKGEALHECVERLRAGGDATQEEIQSCLRSIIRAPEGQRVVVADLANIESRVLGWIAHEPTMLKVFADPTKDIYKDYGESLLRKPAAEIDKAERHYCKPAALGCGYGLGARGLVAYADGMGVAMEQDEAQKAVDAFRSRYSEVPRLWRKLEAATMRLVREAKPAAIRVGRLTFEYDKPWLFMYLPSGRRIAYLQPRIEMKEAPWGDEVETLTYMGMDQYTRKWTRLKTFGGKWVEQACQAIARDVLVDGMWNANEAGFELVGSVHDELITLADADDWRCHEVLEECMARLPAWADQDLYLAAEGFSDVIYRKD